MTSTSNFIGSRVIFEFNYINIIYRPTYAYLCKLSLANRLYYSRCHWYKFYVVSTIYKYFKKILVYWIYIHNIKYSNLLLQYLFIETLEDYFCWDNLWKSWLSQFDITKKFCIWIELLALIFYSQLVEFIIKSDRSSLQLRQKLLYNILIMKPLGYIS